MKRLMFSAFAAAALAGAVSAANVYQVSDRTLTIDVPTGETNSVETAHLACANNNEVTNIVKTGRGSLLMDDKSAIPLYEGDIHVDEGAWVIACANALGKLSSSGDGSGVGEVFVGNGGALVAGGTDRTISNKGKKISIAGDGVDGEGALVLTSTAGDFEKNVFGTNIMLTDNATMGILPKQNVYFNGAAFILNGYKLSFRYNRTDGQRSFVFNGSSSSCEIIAPGEIELHDRGQLIFLGGTSMLGNEGTVTFNDSSSFSSSGMRGRYEWPMIWGSTAPVTITKQTTSDSVTNRNSWHGPVRLDKTMKVAITASGTFGLFGPVTGDGGLDVYWNATAKPEMPTNFVNLGNGGSVFRGGVRVRDLVVNVMERDAVPPEGSAFALTNCALNFDSAKNYELPDGIFHIDGDRAVKGGSGKWNTLVKTGDGTVDYDSAICADVLDLRDGVFKITAQQSAFAGLVEGVGYFGTNGEAYNAAENKNVAYTNRIVMSPHGAYEGKNYWTHKRPEWDANNVINATATIYEGYMWNREPTNVTWTFCSRVGTVAFFYFDGVRKITDGESSLARLVTISDVKPGPHRFRFGFYAQLDMGGPGGSATNFEWPKLGFRWDPLGRGSSDTNNFVKLEDPGDGSLFTWAIPGDDVFYPGTDESNKIGYLPRFDTIKFSGGTLNLNVGTNVFRVGTVYGFPSVVNGNGFAIENKWTIDAEDIAAGMKVLNQKIDFGEDVELEIENPLAARSVSGVREWMVLESTEDITGSISVKDTEVAKRWTVTVSGNSVSLKYRPVGTIMVVR